MSELSTDNQLLPADVVLAVIPFRPSGFCGTRRGILEFSLLELTHLIVVPFGTLWSAQLQ